MATSKRLPMPEMGKVQNQTTFRQLDNVRAVKVDGEIPRTAGAFAEGFESLAKLGGMYVTQKNEEKDAAAKEAKMQDQKLQALRLETGANTALTEFNALLQDNPDKLNDDDWIAEQRDKLLESRALAGVTDEFLREKGTLVVGGGIERMVIEGRQKAAAYEKQTVVGDAIIRIANDFNGAIANAPQTKDALVATGRASIENVIKGLGMDWKSAAPMLVAVAQRNAKEGKHNTFLASVLKDVDDLPAEIRMQMETFEAEGLAQTAVERELARTDLYSKLQPSILDGTFTVDKGRQWVEQGIISADTNISWANQARSNREKAFKEAQERRNAAQSFGALASAGQSVEGYLSLKPKEQDALKAAWQTAFQQRFGDKWVGPYLMQLRSVGAVDEDIQNLAKASAASLTGLVTKEGEVPGAVRALLQNPKVIAAYHAGDLARHIGIDTAQKLIPMLDKFHKTGPDMQGQSPVVDAFNLAAANTVYRPPNAATLKKVNSSVLSDFRPGFWSSLTGGKQTDTSVWKDAEMYAATAYERRIADGASQSDAAKQTKTEMQGLFTKGAKGYVPTELARLHPRGADGVAELVDTQIKTLAKQFEGKTSDFQYTYSNGRLFFLKNGIPVTSATLSANVISSGRGEEFVRDTARKEIKK